MNSSVELRGGGWLEIITENGRVRLSAVRPMDRSGLYKVWAAGQGGGRILVGTMAPEGQVLRAARTAPIGELERCGCWPVTGGEVKLAFRFREREGWQWQCCPGGWVTEEGLKRQLPREGYCREEGERRLLAVPLDHRRPLPLESAFCLAELTRIEGRTCLVWTFDRDGMPLLPREREAHS